VFLDASAEAVITIIKLIIKLDRPSGPPPGLGSRTVEYRKVPVFTGTVEYRYFSRTLEVDR
jgi:hypothetical protein